MNESEQQSLKRIQDAGYVLHYNNGFYKSTVGSGFIFEANQHWIDNETEYLDRRQWSVGELIYKDDVYPAIPLSAVSIREFRAYKGFDVEKLIREFSDASEKQAASV